MKTLKKKIAYQGDVAIEKVSRRPRGLTALKPTRGRHIVAHSETHHHHFVEAAQARFFGTTDPLVCFLVVDGAYADLVHERQVNAHETWRLLKGTYKIIRQREWTPEGWRVVQD